MPRKRNQKPSKKQKDERLRRRWLDDPYKGDIDALRAEVERRLRRHAERLGQDELRRRIIERGLIPPASRRLPKALLSI